MNTLVDPWTVIPKKEFLDRQNRARKAASDLSLDGIIVYSKGGAFMDMSADVLYLTNHYTQVPYMTDHFGLGTSRAHGVAIVPVEGPVVLVADIPYWRNDVVVADDVRVGMDVPQMVCQAMEDTGLKTKHVALVGASNMSAAAYTELISIAGETEFIRTDDLVEQLRLVKSHHEQAIIRDAIAIANNAMEKLMDAAVEGATEAEAIGAAMEIIIPVGCVLYDVACASGSKSHLFTWERLPSYDPRRRLQKGDLFHADFYGAYGGYLWDFARTRIVGNPVSSEQESLINLAIGAVDAMCERIHPGMRGGELYDYCIDWLEQEATARELGVKGEEQVKLVGHGMGLSWEAPCLQKGDDTILEPDMYLAVELFVVSDSVGGALFEHNGFVTKDGFEVLTTCPSRWN
jgi:Xaa-Pro aminopeptidase